MMKLSLYEQETIILYNQAEATAEVYTHDMTLLKKAAAAGRKIPGADKEKGSADLYRPETVRICPGAV